MGTRCVACGSRTDAYRLRGSVSHGDVDAPPYPAAWPLHEHLLLAAVALPLYEKAVPRAAGYYTFPDAFDTLAILIPFAGRPDDESHPWRRTTSRFGSRPLARALARPFEA